MDDVAGSRITIQASPEDAPAPSYIRSAYETIHPESPEPGYRGSLTSLWEISDEDEPGPAVLP